jgi:hypothetical protein
MKAEPTADLLRQIERDCTRLILRFAQAVDSAHYEELAELFVPEGVFYRPAEPERPMSVEAVIDSYRQRLASITCAHLVTNVLISVKSATKAFGSTRILFFGAPREAESEAGKGQKATLQLVGGFQDRFVHTTQGWRFAERRGEMLFNF